MISLSSLEMFKEPKDHHTYEATIDSCELKNEITATIIMSVIGGVRTGDSYEFSFLKNEFIGEPTPRRMAGSKDATWHIKGCISRVAFGANSRTYENRLSTWNDVVSTIMGRIQFIHKSRCTMMLPKNVDLPILTVQDTKKLSAILFKLVYTREDVLDGSVPFALDENIDVRNVSEVFSGFLLTLRTSKYKTAFFKKSGASKTLKSSNANSCTSGVSALPARPSASGNTKTDAGPSGTESPITCFARALGSVSPMKRRKGYTQICDSDSSPEIESDSSPEIESHFKRAASPSSNESPFKRLSRAVASKSPTERAAGPSAASSSPKPSTKEKYNFIFIHGLVNLFQDKQNPIVLPLYNMDKDLVNYLFRRFGCGRIRELQYVKRSKARDFCKKHNIKDPFQ